MRKIVVLTFILLSLKLSAQNQTEKIKIGIQSGYAFYGQEDLKLLNQNVIGQVPFVVKAIDDFDPVFYFGAYIQYGLFNRFYIGPSYEYHYTGSRLGAKDYSGVFSFDQYVHTHQLGLKVDYSFITKTRTSFNIEMNVGPNFTDWKVISDLEIGDIGAYSDLQKDYFKGVSWHFSPALKIDYRLIPSIHLFGAVAYSFDLIKNYHYNKNIDAEVLKTPDWSGFKLSLGMEFNLK